MDIVVILIALICVGLLPLFLGIFDKLVNSIQK